MQSEEEFLELMDFLDLDEEIVDLRLKMIMSKKRPSKRYLISAIQLLNYKQLNNLKEGSECENNEEFEFVAHLVMSVDYEIIEYVCRIIRIVLNLNSSTRINKSEHLLQQMLSSVSLLEDSKNSAAIEHESNILCDLKTILNLKMCDTVLDVIIENGETVTLLFLEIPLESIFFNQDNQVVIYFLNKTVPRLFEAVAGYDILDNIWNYVKDFERNNFGIVINMLGCLSEFYLPIADNEEKNILKSKIIYDHEFWNVILSGLKECSLRKTSIYLAKRAIDYLIKMRKDIEVKHHHNSVMTWKCEKENELKSMWNNYFILIDSLEERQSNIVLPALKLFESLNKVEKCWLDCVFEIGLKHENHQVRLICIDYKLESSINHELEVQTLLEALNDTNIYTQICDYTKIKEKVATKCKDLTFLVCFIKRFPLVKWSPVPLYHLSTILALLCVENLFVAIDYPSFRQIIRELLKIPCSSILLKNAVVKNIMEFVKKSCKSLHWEQIVEINTIFNVKTNCLENNNILLNKQILTLKNEEKGTFFKVITNAHVNIDLCLWYLYNNEEDIQFLFDIIQHKIVNLHETIQRQYSDRSKSLNDVIFLISLLRKTENKQCHVDSIINSTIVREYETLLKYILCMLSSEIISPLEASELFSIFEYKIDFDIGCKDILLQIFKLSMLLLEGDGTDIVRQVFCAALIRNVVKNKCIEPYPVALSKIVDISFLKLEKLSTNKDSGKLRNILDKEYCEIIFLLIQGTHEIEKNLNKIVNFLIEKIDCGACDCLIWLLKITNKILPAILNDKNIKFDIIELIKKIWIEIEELKSNNQYSSCMEDFIKLITQDELLKTSAYNNIIMLYCSKIIEHASLKSTPLYHLINELNKKDVLRYPQLGHVLSEILQYCPVPRKDQRIVESIAIQILHNSQYRIRLGLDIHFDFQIQYLALSTLCKTQSNVEITKLMTKKIDEIFKNKERYHKNSQPHLTLMTVLQHLLIINLLASESAEMDRITDWCMKLLGKLPHQPSVRICLEWYITLNYYRKQTIVSDEILQQLTSNNVPLTSQFVIMYWILRHKVLNDLYSIQEFEFVMDTLLSHTMGQIFNVRLHAQFLAKKLHMIAENSTRKYDCVINIIEKTFLESHDEKLLVKLQNYYFINDFDIISDLTPCFIYYFIPKYYDVSNSENVNINFVRYILRQINESINQNVTSNTIKSEWKVRHKTDDEIFSMNLQDTKSESIKITENQESMGTIQKKYIPWKNMTEIDVYEIGKKREKKGDLILVASLIDKLPNLGGMARTGEVFGVKTYVVSSLRHLQDKQFQGLSVSAERWIDIEEVRPGSALKTYLMKKKSEGYTLVAAEQTSTSRQLQTFKFPRKTLLILGHEKEGVPCYLLPMMDVCLEIPQKGVVRSLNVHVTAAIFIWEYSRQNNL